MTSALVTLHGFTGNAHSWQPVTNPDLALNLLGHHPSVPADASATFTDEVDRVARMIERAEMTAVHLAGYSMGARVALGVAIRHPSLLSRLTLIGVHPGLRGEEERRERAAQDADWRGKLENEGIEAFVDAWEAMPWWASQESLPSRVRAAQRAVRASHDPLGLAAALRVLGLSVMPNYWPDLSSIEIPVHLIVGELDRKFRAVADEMLTHMDSAKLSLVPGCGHNPLLEKPRVLAALMREGADDD